MRNSPWDAKQTTKSWKYLLCDQMRYCRISIVKASFEIGNVMRVGTAFHLLLQNHWANFNQTGHFFGEGDPRLFK
jgi:hypothetical protein